MSTLTFDEAKKAEGQPFKLLLKDGRELDLTLTKVMAYNKTPPFPGKIRDPFSLFFVGTPDILCPQQVYPFRNQTLGDVEMFIVPIGFDEATRMYRYQAVFN